MYGAYQQPASRSSTSSTNTSNSSQGGYVSRNPGDVPTAVHNLLLSTKQLQKILTQWSLGQVSETQVSDVYVQIGTDFNTAIQAFAYHRIELSEIHSVPQELRTVLEQCLAEDPSPQVLSMFMPEVKQVLVKLLRGLQAKQEAWRMRGAAPYDFR
ncbi:Bud site selection protein 6 [Mycena venus]|uniref:Bud site selection protein 6 n=1 Tax=Mycena venus TaxID=2733690 RepID=A0A8H7DCX3_9AGAR|nr:Bud site selection protein 6 [Mycena venus]